MGEDVREGGRIALLIVGLTVVVVAFALVSAGITAVHVQDRRLLACADSVAAVAATVVDAEAFYSVGDEGQRLVPSPDGVRGAAASALDRLRTTTCDIGAGVALEDVRVDGPDVLVTLAARADLPLVPPMLGDVAAPRLVATSSARPE